jgi:nitroreductase
MAKTTADVLAEAAATAGAAPSIHNTQPWRWQVRPDRLDLYAERGRQLAATDPDGRMLTISCGTALHHARAALAARGWRTTVVRLPDPARPDLLARITLADRIPVSPQAMRRYQTIRLRHTDRRPVTRQTVSRATLDALAKAAADEGAHLHVLHPDQVDDLAVAVARAATVDADDPAIQAELDRWTGGPRTEGSGIPDEAIPQRPPRTNVPVRAFAHSGTLSIYPPTSPQAPAIGGEHDKSAAYAILYGDTDDPAGWLRAGEALSAVWLTAVEHGVGVLPISEAVEMPASRQALRRTLSFFGWPYLAMRLGIPDPDHAGPAHAPRLPAERTVDGTSGPAAARTLSGTVRP